MLHGFREIKLSADNQWNADVFLLRPTPKGDDPWGALAPLRGTEWEGTITVVDGTLLSHALHGHKMPLLRALKAQPTAMMRRMAEHTCSLKTGRQCINASKDCHPCEKLPECYNAPMKDEGARYAATVVALAWRKGYHVIVATEEGEFSL